jgi:hypothetical protein
MSAKIFLSTVSDEFRAYRDQLRSDLTRHNVEVKVQEDFIDLGGARQARCLYRALRRRGASDRRHDRLRSGRARAGCVARYPDLADKLPPLGEAMRIGSGVSYTQWEAWLALYHGKLLFIAKADDSAARGPKPTPDIRLRYQPSCRSPCS